MSYLSALRLHFAGRFQANVSTVNNDPSHFNNAAFQPGYQDMQGPGMQPPNGWFNPQGDAAWRFLGCKITSAWMPSGRVAQPDSVLACIVADSDTRPPAKLVDLDSEQQLVSEIWGLQVRIARADGTTLMTGDFKPAAFLDIWDRASGGASGGDQIAGATYQSVLGNLQWSDVSDSPFLTSLKEASQADGLLSIKFNVDSFNLSFKSPDFMTGRIAGTIGPASKTEPRHLIMGRQFMAASAVPPGNFFGPAGLLNFFPARVDEKARNIFLDLGNALPTAPDGSMANLGPLTLSASEPIGTIQADGADGYASSTNPHWYADTAGIVVLPLTPSQLEAVTGRRLSLTSPAGAAIYEWSNGAFVRADRYVYRMSPGDTAQIPVYAMQFGQPMVNAPIRFDFDQSQMQVGSGFPYSGPCPPVATSPDAIQYNNTVTTDTNGRVLLKVTASDPGTPRYFTDDFGIDGQLYGLRPGFADPSVTGNNPINQWNFISFLVWSGFQTKTPGQPTWHDDLQPIFVQYANLYPVMNRFLNLADYDSVVKNARLLSLAFGLNPADANSMPVTRDLSPAKRTAILTWLSQSPPPLGTPPPAQVKLAAVEESLAAPSQPPLAAQGGKIAAAARRIAVQKAKGV